MNRFQWNLGISTKFIASHSKFVIFDFRKRHSHTYAQAANNPANNISSQRICVSFVSKKYYQAIICGLENIDLDNLCRRIYCWFTIEITYIKSSIENAYQSKGRHRLNKKCTNFGDSQLILLEAWSYPCLSKWFATTMEHQRIYGVLMQNSCYNCFPDTYRQRNRNWHRAHRQSGPNQRACRREGGNTATTATAHFLRQTNVCASQKRLRFFSSSDGRHSKCQKTH